MILRCHCGFIDCDRCTSLLGVLIKAEAVHMGQRVCGEPLHFPLRFAVKLQLFEKKKDDVNKQTNKKKPGKPMYKISYSQSSAKMHSLSESVGAGEESLHYAGADIYVLDFLQGREN